MIIIDYYEKTHRLQGGNQIALCDNFLSTAVTGHMHEEMIDSTLIMLCIRCIAL